jgi:hypothetical protein
MRPLLLVKKSYLFLDTGGNFFVPGLVPYRRYFFGKILCPEFVSLILGPWTLQPARMGTG